MTAWPPACVPHCRPLLPGQGLRLNQSLEQDKEGSISLLLLLYANHSHLCINNFFFLTLSCLMSMVGVWAGSPRAACTHQGGLLSTHSQALHVSEILHMAAMFAERVWRVPVGQAPACCSCPWLLLSARAAQPLVFTSTTVASSLPVGTGHGVRGPPCRDN